MKLSDAESTFVLHWGEMGSRWGINRAIAQVHAALLVAPKPLDAQEICEALDIARSNVSTALRELQSWGIVRLVHVMGDRREHFEADKDPWNFLAKIAERRIEHEIQPTITLLTELMQHQRDPRSDLRRLFAELVEVMESGVRFFKRLRAFSPRMVKRFLKLDAQLDKLMHKAD